MKNLLTQCKRITTAAVAVCMMLSLLPTIARAENLSTQDTLRLYAPFLEKVVKTMTSPDVESREGFIQLIKLVESDEALRAADGICEAYNVVLREGVDLGPVTTPGKVSMSAFVELDGYIVVLHIVKTNHTIHDKQFYRITVLKGDSERGKAYVYDTSDFYRDTTPNHSNRQTSWDFLSAEYRNGVAVGTATEQTIYRDGNEIERENYFINPSYPSETLETWDLLRGKEHPISIAPTEDSVSAAQEYSTVLFQGSYSAAVDVDGNLWMWGENQYGRLGNGTVDVSSAAPVKILDHVASVSCAYDFAAAVKEDGSLWTWGSNYSGRLGNGGISNDASGNIPCQTIPQKIMDDVDSVLCTDLTIYIIKNDRSLWILGTDVRCSDVMSSTINVPTKVMDNIVTVSASNNEVAAIKTDGSLWVWERYYDWRDKPVSVSEPHKILSDVRSVSVGISTAAIKTDGTLWTWGNNESGTVGNGGAYDTLASGVDRVQTVPVKIMDNVSSVCFGGSTVAAIKTDGSLWMWGRNRRGEIGLGLGGNFTERTGALAYNSPVHVMDDVSAVDIGSSVAAIKKDRSLWIWGGDVKTFQYEDGHPDKFVSTPMKVLSDVAVARSGAQMFAAVKTDGTLWTWGDNTYELLGYSGGDYSYTPDFIVSSEGRKFDPRDFDCKIQTTPRQVPGLTLKLTSAPAAGADPVPQQLSALAVTVNGKEVAWTDAMPFIDANNRTMVPLRAVGNALGLTVSWNGEKREASFSNGTKTIFFPIDYNLARTSDGQTIQMDTAAVIVNNRTYAPVRYLAEFFGHTVEWAGATRTVVIK